MNDISYIIVYKLVISKLWGIGFEPMQVPTISGYSYLRSLTGNAPQPAL